MYVFFFFAALWISFFMLYHKIPAAFKKRLQKETTGIDILSLFSPFFFFFFYRLIETMESSFGQR
jgi:hypothetical protein